MSEYVRVLTDIRSILAVDIWQWFKQKTENTMIRKKIQGKFKLKFQKQCKENYFKMT